VFEGNRHVSDRDLRATLKPPPWWNVFRWFSRDRFERDQVEMAEALIRELYLDRGYLEVEVSPPAIEKDAEGRLTIRYRIREGIAYRFGQVAVRGNKLFPAEKLLASARARPGAVASQSDVAGTRRAIEDLYGTQGYIDTVARPRLQPDRTNATVDVVFDVKESGQVFVRNVLVQGNERTREKVIRREVLVQPGEVFDEVRVRRSERILENLGYFEAVRADARSTLNEGERDLVFTVEEKSTGQFHVGAGFSSIDRLIGFSELSQGNFDLFGYPYFTGGGQKLRLRGEYGGRRREYSIDFTEPWFLDRKLALGVELFRLELDYSDYDVQRTGGGVSLSKALPGANRVRLGYRLVKSVISDVADTNRYVYADPPQDDFYFSREEDLLSSSLRLTLSHDTRNRPFVPTRGNLSSVYGELTGGPLGFDTEVYELGGSAAQYVPLWFGHVLHLRARCEVIESYGDMDEVPLSRRLFAGGARTIRGFRYRDVGPKVVPADPSSTSRSYRPAGGQTLLLAKADYTVPLVQGIRLAAFFDAGNVWRDPYELELEEYASAWGLGIRLDVPGFPISVDYAWPVERDDEFTRTDAWSFWIGYDL
jgi:outer membrane protein insertion porin family